MTSKVFKFLKLFASFKEYETEQGKLVIDELSEGAEVMVQGEDGELVAAADGEYVTEDGKITVADGKIVSIEEVKDETIEEPVEETPVEEPTEEPVEEEQPKEEETTEEQPVEEPAVNPELEEAKRIIEEKDAKITELEVRIAELEAELAKPIEEPLEMKAVAKPCTPTIKDNPVLKYFAD